MAGKQSIEFKVFIETRETIRTGLLHNLNGVASAAYARNLIGDEVHRFATGTDRVVADERVEKFLHGLGERIRNDPTILEKFVEVLKAVDAAFFRVVINTISKM